MRQYRGVTTEHGRMVLVEEAGESRGLDPRFDLPGYAADGFGWGENAPGGRQLALALAADATGDPTRAAAVADELYVRLVAALPADAWAVCEREVVEAVRDLEWERAVRRLDAAEQDHAAALGLRLARHLGALATERQPDPDDRLAVMRERGWMEALSHLAARDGLTHAGRVEAGKLVAASEDWLREQRDEPATGWVR